MRRENFNDNYGTMESYRRTPLFFAIAFRLLLFIASIAMILSYIAVYVNPSDFSFPLFFGLYYIPILFINIILLLIALLWKSKSAWIPLIVLLPSLLYAEEFIKIGNGSKKIKQEGIKLKIESYNAGMFYSSREEYPRYKTLKLVEDQIYKDDPDIVCLQEVFVDSKAQIKLLFNKYSYRVYHLYPAKNGRFFGNMTLSKFKIKSAGRIGFHHSTNLAIYTDIEHYGRTLRVYNNHLESYNISFSSLVQRLGKESEDDKTQLSADIINVHAKVKGTVIRRSNQVNIIAESIKKSPYPTIVCGDFNDTPMSYTYHHMSRGKKDSFRESGSGFAATFSYLWPLLRIDYILFPTEFQGLSHKTIKDSLSDHYPIVAEIVIPGRDNTE